MDENQNPNPTSAGDQPATPAPEAPKAPTAPEAPAEGQN